MDAVILNYEKECYNFEIDIAGRPLADYISEWLHENSVEKSEIISFKNQKTTEEEIREIIKKKSEIILITKPMITDISLKKAIDFHKRNKNSVTLIYNNNKSTGIYIISKGDIYPIREYLSEGYFSFISSLKIKFSVNFSTARCLS